MRGFLHIAVTLTLCALALTCKKPTEPPPPGEQPVSFSAIDASCTEIWLSVKFHPDAQPRIIEIKRDTLSVLTATLTGTDTLIVDEGLLPHREYTYTLTRPGVWQDRPLTATITTMDTSSSNWVFDQPVLLGDGGSSVLYDVAIINDTLAYAVGAIYKRDSVGNWDPNAYNIARWNGRQWQLARVYTGSTCNPVNYAPLKAIWAFSDTNILVTSGGSLGWYNGRTNVPDCSIRPLVTGAINRIWASSPNNVYVVGNNGFIAHYNGTSWRRLESGTTAEIKDIWGAIDSATGTRMILCAASNQFEPSDRRILRISPHGTVDSLSWRTDRRASSVWFTSERQIFVTGGGVFIGRANGTWVEQTTIPLYYTYRVRGVARNDAHVCGGFGLLAHWNGIGWHVWENTGAFIWYSVAVSTHRSVVVGQTSGGQAIVLQTRR